MLLLLYIYILDPLRHIRNKIYGKRGASWTTILYPEIISVEVRKYLGERRTTIIKCIQKTAEILLLRPLLPLKSGL